MGERIELLKKTVSGIMLILISIGLLSLAWNIQSVRALATGNIVVTTSTANRVLKLNSDGNILWNIDMGLQTGDSAINPSDGTIYVISNDNVNANLTKFDSNGNILWNKDISFMCLPGSGGPCTVDVDPSDGSAYVVAAGGSFGVHKYNSTGSLLWSRIVNFQSVAVNPTDGTVYVNDCFGGVFKYDSNGNLIWQSAIYGTAGYGSESIKVNPFDGSTVASYRFEAPVVKLDTNGQLIWITGTGTDQCAVAIDPYRNAVYLTCAVYEYDWEGPRYLYKLDLTTGEIVWTRYISHTLSMNALAVDYQDGNIYVADWNGTLHKMNPNDGNIVWSKNLGYQICRISVENELHGFVNATVAFDYDALNLKSIGDWVIAYVELPEGYNVNGIDVSTVMLNGTISAELAPTAVGDYDGDGIPDLMVRFNRTLLVEYLISNNITSGNATLNITGLSTQETEPIHRVVTVALEGSSEIKVSSLVGDVNCDGTVNLFDAVTALASYGSQEGDANWNPNANFAPSWKQINLYDIVTLVYHYGETSP